MTVGKTLRGRLNKGLQRISDRLLESILQSKLRDVIVADKYRKFEVHLSEGEIMLILKNNFPEREELLELRDKWMQKGGDYYGKD